jgi:hypothetical protein
MVYRFVTISIAQRTKQEKMLEAECIVLAGASRLLTPYTLPPFDQNSQTKTVHHFPSRSTGSGKEARFLD